MASLIKATVRTSGDLHAMKVPNQQQCTDVYSDPTSDINEILPRDILCSPPPILYLSL